jgi:hypothetical protein
VALSPDQLWFADRLFELRVLRSNGQAYEDLFVEIMSRRYPGFRAVKPQGSIGDRKNDGYCSDSGVYHQVYAPENAEDNESKAVTKIATDFHGLVDYWNPICPVTGYYFVLNDKFRGTYPTVERTLLELKQRFALRECGPFLNKDLMRVFAELPERDVIAITGHLPSPEIIGDLDFSMFRDVLAHVIKNPTLITPEALLTVPDFDHKISVNRISAPVARLLTNGNLQSGAVESFFGSSTGVGKTAVRDKLAAIYADLKKSLNGTTDAIADSGDLIFFGLLDAITPELGNPFWQQAAIVLLGYFFESCDIYEDPAKQGDLFA